MKTFLEHYQLLISEFSYENFVEIDCKGEKIKWPKSSGVYLIWKNSVNTIDNLLYIGMTGKFKRVNSEKIIFNSGSLNKRINRWTPYRFCESIKDGKNRFTFRFGPLIKNVNQQYKIRYDNKSYHSTIKYSDLTIHCFLISEHNEKYTPELLEKQLLTLYLKEFGDLPPANNEL